MLRVLSQVAVTMVFATALGAAPGNSKPDSKQQGAPGQIQEKVKPEVEPVKTRKSQVGKASWYGRIFQHKPPDKGGPYDRDEGKEGNCSRPLAVPHVSTHSGASHPAAGFLDQGYKSEK